MYGTQAFVGSQSGITATTVMRRILVICVFALLVSAALAGPKKTEAGKPVESGGSKDTTTKDKPATKTGRIQENKAAQRTDRKEQK